MKKVLLFMSVLTILLGAALPVGVVSAGAPGADAGVGAACDATWFLGLKPWWSGLTVQGDPKCPIEVKNGDIPRFIGILAMNILQNISMIVTYAAIGFIIYGGFRYITAQGSPDNITKAKKTIQNAVIGLVIGMFAAVGINIVFNVLGL